jgi:hypothetical protein
VGEDLLDDAGVGEEGEELAFSAAVGAGQHVQEEDALEKLPGPFSGYSGRGDLASLGCGPGKRPPRPLLARGVGRIGCVRRSARVQAIDLRDVVVFGLRFGNDSIAEGGGGSEDSVVGGEVDAGSGDEGGEPLDQGDGGEDHVRRSVLPASLELVEHFVAVGAQ